MSIDKIALYWETINKIFLDSLFFFIILAAITSISYVSITGIVLPLKIDIALFFYISGAVFGLFIVISVIILAFHVKNQ